MSHVSMAIRETSYREEFERYIITRLGWDIKEIFDTIDWPVRKRAAKKIKGTQQITLFKLKFDLFATMKTVDTPLGPQQPVCLMRIVTSTLALFYKKKHRTNFSHRCWYPCYCHCVCLYIVYIVSLLV